MISYITKNIDMLEHIHINGIKIDAKVIPVNCVGVMGKGLALQFKNKYPTLFKRYLQICQNKVLTIGIPYFLKYDCCYILFPTKDHWREESKYYYIILGLSHMIKLLHYHKINSIIIPRLGCGLGGLDWDIVHDMILKEFNKKENENINVFLYR
jgi:O-acetyl-ADP-ribose deacetylase (regulator of RNase III)